jgi:hypothetical protein
MHIVERQVTTLLKARWQSDTRPLLSERPRRSTGPASSRTEKA